MIRYNGNYGNYNEYGARMRDNRGRYMGEYGRRGVAGTGRGRYSGVEDMLDEMRENYSAYNESMGAYSRGNYNAGEDGMEALENAMKIFTDCTEKMIEQAESPEEKQIIKKYLHKISQMG